MNSTDQYWSANYDNSRDYTQLKTADLLDIIEHANPPTGKHLDIGCGTGMLTRELFHLGFQSTGVDISKTAINLAKRASVYNDQKLHYIHGDFMTLSFSDTFALITCKLVYAFIENKPEFLEKVTKLLDTDGSFILITPTYASDADATPISVNRHDVTAELHATFAYVHEKDLGWARCFICKK